MNPLELILFLLMFISHAIFLLIVLYNYNTAPKLSNIPLEQKDNDLISIMIPARNEEKNISALLDSILRQSYSNYEILVLDDFSQDNTYSIINEYSKKDRRITVFKGSELPDDWLGKNWACYQLAQQAKGNYLLFIDADVTLAEHSIANAVNELKNKNASMLSVFPTQKIHGFGALLVVPLMNWLLLNFLPLKFVYKTKNRQFTAANGQFLLIETDVYKQIGTHQSVKDKVVEDMEIVRKVKSEGFKAITLLGNDSVFCEMYESFPEAFYGFSKNFYRGFNLPKSAFFLLITVLLILFLFPFFLIILNPVFVLICFLVIVERMFISILSMQNWLVNILLHPLQMIIMFAVGINSIASQKLKWKGRQI